MSNIDLMKIDSLVYNGTSIFLSAVRGIYVIKVNLTQGWEKQKKQCHTKAILFLAALAALNLTW